MKSAVALALAVVITAVAAGSSTAEPRSECVPARVNYTPYGGSGQGLSRTPWVGATPGRYRLRGLLWYWPQSWRNQQVPRVRIYLHGKVPQGWSTKILWAFLGEPAKNHAGPELVVRGRRLDGRGSFKQSFASIGYEGQDGAPSYASVIDVPKAGCWRLGLSSGDVRVSVVFRAIRG
jgi:hypothetical protein